MLKGIRRMLELGGIRRILALAVLSGANLDMAVNSFTDKKYLLFALNTIAGFILLISIENQISEDGE
jgi:hypothetical protein